MRTNWVAVVILSLSTLLGSCGGSKVNAPALHNLRIDVSDATWVAYQDGDGAWQPLLETELASLARTDAAPPVRQLPDKLLRQNRLQHPRLPLGEPRVSVLQEKTYMVPIQNEDGRYGVAQVCVDPEYGSADLYIELSTVGETPNNYVSCYFGNDEPSYTLFGHVNGLGPNDTGAVYADFDEMFVSSDSPSYSFELEQDFYDVVATRLDGFSSAPNSVIFQGNIPVSQNQSLDLDFGGDDAFTPELRSVQIKGSAAGALLSGGVTLLTDNYTYVPLGQLDQGTAFDYAAIPAEKLSSKARYYLYADTRDGPGGTAVSISRMLTTPVYSTLTLPKSLARANAVVESSTPYLRPTATWRSYPGEKVSYDNFYFQFLNDSFLSAYVYMHASWLPSIAEFTYTMPDFTGVTGWQNAWGLKPDMETSWDVSAYSETGTYGDDGYEQISADISGSFNNSGFPLP